MINTFNNEASKMDWWWRKVLLLLLSLWKFMWQCYKKGHHRKRTWDYSLCRACSFCPCLSDVWLTCTATYCVTTEWTERVFPTEPSSSFSHCRKTRFETIALASSRLLALCIWKRSSFHWNSLVSLDFY